jgi:iron(III) transport system permease protein
MSALGGIGSATLVRRRRLGPAPLWLLALPIGAVLLLPLAFVGVQASGAGWTKAIHLLRLPHVDELLRNTIELVVLVPPLCAIVGAGVAWLLERTDLPGRRFWAVVLALPLAVPEFVNGYAWVGLNDSVHGLFGAVLVSTLSYYPLVMLPAIATLRRSDAALEDVARSQGLRSLAVFARVTLPQLRLALLGGGLIIALHLLAEYGAFSLLGFRTFTTEIYTEYQLGFDAASSAVLSLVLVGFCLLLLGAESGLQGRTPPTSETSSRRRRTQLGLRVVPALGALGGVAALAVGVPVGALVYWLIVGSSTTLPSASITGAAVSTVSLGLAAALITTLAAVPVAVLAVRYPTRLARLLERSAYIARAMPGLIIALALAYFAVRHAFALYQSSLLLVTAYAVLGFPLALIAIRPSIAQASPRLEEAARSLGQPPLAVFRRVTLPLIAPGLAAAVSIVFLSSVTELTATLVLRPTGTETLATRFWTYSSGLAYGAAAPYAALMIAISAIPTYFLVRWFDALTATST